MKHNKIFFPIILFSILTFQCVLSQSDTVQIKPVAIKGVIDLSNWDFKAQGTAKLDGEWEFYWKQLLNPENFNDTNRNFQKQYIKVQYMD